MAGEGAKLRDARNKKGWSLQDAEEVTKIRIRYLEALEEENYAILPGSVYVKGFLRNYAKHLEINSDEIIALYQESLSLKTEPTLPESKNFAPERPRRIKPLLIAVLGIALLGTAIYMLGSNNSDPQPPASGYTPSPVPNPPEQQLPEEEIPQPNEPSGKEPNSEETPAYEGLHVELTFDENCWLRYRVDNEPIIEKTYVAGSTIILEAKDSVSFLSIGNAGGLNITANGQKLTKLGKSGDVIKNYTLTKETIVPTGENAAQ